MIDQFELDAVTRSIRVFFETAWMAPMAKFEGSAKDVREDKAQAKKRGMSMKDWEASPADRKHDAEGDRAMASKHKRKKLPPMKRPMAPPSAPMPAPNEFDAAQEQAMRAGARQSRMPPADEDMDGM